MQRSDTNTATETRKDTSTIKEVVHMGKAGRTLDDLHVIYFKRYIYLYIDRYIYVPMASAPAYCQVSVAAPACLQVSAASWHVCRDLAAARHFFRS